MLYLLAQLHVEAIRSIRQLEPSIHFLAHSDLLPDREVHLSMEKPT
jgi:hypothetical protein